MRSEKWKKSVVLHIKPSLFHILHVMLEVSKSGLPSSLLNIQKNDWAIKEDDPEMLE